MEKTRSKVLMLTEGGMMIALSALLSYIRIYQAPNGGSVTAGSMIPIMIFAIRWGLGPGLAVGVTYGMLDFILKPFFVHPLQLLLDYPLAFGSLGLAGLAYILTTKKGHKGYGPVLLGVTLAITSRLIFHVLSGVVFFAEYAGDQNPWVYSIIYNASYLVPELIISMIVMVLVWKPIQKFIR